MSADLETRLRALPEQLAGLHAPTDLADVVRGRHRQHRRRRVMAAAAAVLAVLVGSTVAVGGARDAGPALPAEPIGTPAPPPRGSAPTDPHLLPWPTRGPLAGDPEERLAVLRDLEVAARSAASSFLRPPSDAPTHILWLGPAYPTPLPVRTRSVAVVQQWTRGEARLGVLEKAGGRYVPIGGSGGSSGFDPATAQLWVPAACKRPPAGVYCPHRFAALVLTAPGIGRIRFTSDPRERNGADVHPDRWRELPTVDGYAFFTLDPAELVSGRVPRITADGTAPPGFSLSVSGQLGPAAPTEPSPAPR